MLEQTVHARNAQSGPRAGRLLRRVDSMLSVGCVAVIAAIIAAVVVPRFMPRSPHPGNPAKQDVSNIKVALGTFQIENGRFPTTAEGIQALVANPGNLPNWTKSLEKVPVDKWGRAYIYRCPGATGDDYDLFSAGAGGQEVNADNIDPQ